MKRCKFCNWKLEPKKEGDFCSDLCKVDYLRLKSKAPLKEFVIKVRYPAHHRLTDLKLKKQLYTMGDVVDLLIKEYEAKNKP